MWKVRAITFFLSHGGGLRSMDYLVLTVFFHPFLCSDMSFIGKVFFRLVDNFCYLLTASGFSKFVPPVLWSSRTGMFFFSLGSKVGGLFDIDVMIYF